MAERGAASALPLLLLSLLVLGRALMGGLEAAQRQLPQPWPLLLAAALVAVIAAALIRRRGLEEACFTAVSSSYASPGEIIAETRWLEEALRRVSREGGYVRAVYDGDSFRICIRARDASRLVAYLREFSSNILIVYDHGSGCRRVLFHRLEEALPRYLVSGAVIVLAKRYSLGGIPRTNIKIIDVSDIVSINKKIIRIVNEISSLRRGGFKPRRIIFVDLVEAEPSSIYSLLKTRSLLPHDADCIALINSIEQQILTS